MIEQTLERIAIALEGVVAELQAHRQTDSVAPVAPVAPAAPPPVAPVMPTPPMAPMTAPGPSPVPAALPPSAPAPAPQVQAVPTLDDIRALANDFHRAHPERAAEVVGILASVNAQKLSEIPPAAYPQVHAQLKALAGV